MIMLFCSFVSILGIIILFLRYFSLCDMHEQKMLVAGAFTMFLLLMVFFWSRTLKICDMLYAMSNLNNFLVS